eukprot:TRINITY_DN750_c0_g3_i1.p1 TRINITY_DN750_c0_g3~~TRINITY_DN750_c0_g3_i1.p1  ORF type:complete len:152 (+),score=34.59 TRINITY_DN750_c0_g3_i1:2-457(+)
MTKSASVTPVGSSERDRVMDEVFDSAEYIDSAPRAENLIPNPPGERVLRPRRARPDWDVEPEPDPSQGWSDETLREQVCQEGLIDPDESHWTEQGGADPNPNLQGVRAQTVSTESQQERQQQQQQASQHHHSQPPQPVSYTHLTLPTKRIV